MNNNENRGFSYNYSAREQAELKRIREKYLTDTESAELSTLARVRRLDASVTKKGTISALIIGIIGALVMGFGMSLVMTDIKSILGEYSGMALVIGIAIGFIGMLGVIAAYPLYRRITAIERKKLAPEILKLTDELIDPSR